MDTTHADPWFSIVIVFIILLLAAFKLTEYYAIGYISDIYSAILKCDLLM